MHLLSPVTRRAAVLAAAATFAVRLPVAADVGLPFTFGGGPERARLTAATALKKPGTLPRRRLEMDFAVLLMRTSYNVADQLDYTPMNDFQREFFLFRQQEWEDYKSFLPNTMQGDLTDPYYFDFISFCQYATIASGMRNGRMLFQELVGAEGSPELVSRDPALADNALLPAAHAQRVGDALLAAICDKYKELSPKVPRDITATALIEGVRGLMDIFEINDYLLQYRLDKLDDGFELALVAPATLWSQQVLGRRQDLANDFEAKVASAFLRRCSVAATYTTTASATEVVHRFRWPRNLAL